MESGCARLHRLCRPWSLSRDAEELLGSNAALCSGTHPSSDARTLRYAARYGPCAGLRSNAALCIGAAAAARFEESYRKFLSRADRRCTSGFSCRERHAGNSRAYSGPSAGRAPSQSSSLPPIPIPDSDSDSDSDSDLILLLPLLPATACYCPLLPRPHYTTTLHYTTAPHHYTTPQYTTPQYTTPLYTTPLYTTPQYTTSPASACSVRHEMREHLFCKSMISATRACLPCDWIAYTSSFGPQPKVREEQPTTIRDIRRRELTSDNADEHPTTPTNIRRRCRTSRNSDAAVVHDLQNYYLSLAVCYLVRVSCWQSTRHRNNNACKNKLTLE